MGGCALRVKGGIQPLLFGSLSGQLRHSALLVNGHLKTSKFELWPAQQHRLRRRRNHPSDHLQPAVGVDSFTSAASRVSRFA